MAKAVGSNALAQIWQQKGMRMFDRYDSAVARLGKIALALVLVLVGVGLGMMLTPKAALPTQNGEITGETKVAVERLIRNYILEHPEILPEAMGRLSENEVSQRLGAVRQDLEKPFANAVLGNPAGTVTLVQFTDYACGYCRQSVADVEALIAANPDLKVVVRELPVLGAPSVEAAKLALAAAGEGRYAVFHKAMFAAGPPTEAAMARAAAQAGLHLPRARGLAASDRVAAELRHNVELARQLKFSGTPSWVVGGQMFSGAVGFDRLNAALAQARGSS